MIEEDKIISSDVDVAVTPLNTNIPLEYINQTVDTYDPINTITVDTYDPINTIIGKFSKHPSILSIRCAVNAPCFTFNEVGLAELQAEINKLDATKSSMSDGIPTKLLKNYSYICNRPILNIINYCIRNAIFDDDVKLANITPTHKKDDITDKNNYGPISILPTVSKLFERIIQNQIVFFIENTLNHHLYGYRKGFSTQHAIISLLERWIDKKGFGGAVLMDLSKAFDTLTHDLLTAKLHAYDFSYSALSLIKSYLAYRWQRTKINTTFSSWPALLSCVTQGLAWVRFFSTYFLMIYFT